MRHKILQITPADGWVVRGRLDEFWRDSNLLYPEHLRDSHIVTHDPVVCFALMENADGERLVEPMVSSGDGIVPLCECGSALKSGILRDDRTGWIREQCECLRCTAHPENTVCPVPDDKIFFSRDNFSVRVLSCLRNVDIDTVQQICQMTERDLLRLPNFWRKSLDEVKKALGQYGLKLKPEEKANNQSTPSA